MIDEEKRMKKGKVYLIGAGPGDPELFTLKGKRCLEKSGCYCRGLSGR